jgi:hypothetical protein
MLCDRVLSMAYRGLQLMILIALAAMMAELARPARTAATQFFGGGGSSAPVAIPSAYFTALPSSCSTGVIQVERCLDCKSTADGIVAGSACQAGGRGALAVCWGNAWYCSS